MKKVGLLLLLLLFAPTVFAQDVFLSLTKTAQNPENLTTNVTIITQEEIAQKHVDSIGQLLQTQVGMAVTNNGYLGSVASVFARGSSSRETLVMIDGRRINDIGLGGADLANIPVNIIERIEIIRGAGASIYGTNAFGSVINIITKKASPNSPLAEAGYEYGAFNTVNPYINASYFSQKIGIFGSQYFLETDGPQFPNDNTYFKNQNTFFSAQGYLTDTLNISLTGNYYNSKLGVSGVDSDLGGTQTPYNYQEDFKRYIKFDINESLGDFSINANAYGSENIRNYYDATSNPYASDPKYIKLDLTDSKFKYISDTYGYQGNLHYKDLVLVGVERWQENYEQKEFYSGRRLQESRINSAVFSQLNFSIWKFDILPSARGDRDSIFGDVFTPGLALIFHVNDKIKFSGNAGKVWDAPAFSDLYSDGLYTPGNPELKPERGDSFDMGAQYLDEKINFSVTTFYVKTYDLITWGQIKDDPLGRWTPQNIDSTRQQGYEFELGQKIIKQISHSIKYTWTESVDDTPGQSYGEPLANRPREVISWTLTLMPIENLTLQLSALYHSKTFVEHGADNKDIYLSPFSTIDLNVNFDITKNITFWARGTNISNTRYQLNQYYVMPGAAYYAGASVKLFR